MQNNSNNQHPRQQSQKSRTPLARTTITATQPKDTNNCSTVDCQHQLNIPLPLVRETASWKCSKMEWMFLFGHALLKVGKSNDSLVMSLCCFLQGKIDPNWVLPDMLHLLTVLHCLMHMDQQRRGTGTKLNTQSLMYDILPVSVCRTGFSVRYSLIVLTEFLFKLGVPPMRPSLVRSCGFLGGDLLTWSVHFPLLQFHTKRGYVPLPRQMGAYE